MAKKMKMRRYTQMIGTELRLMGDYSRSAHCMHITAYSLDVEAKNAASERPLPTKMSMLFMGKARNRHLYCGNDLSFCLVNARLLPHNYRRRPRRKPGKRTSGACL